MKKTFSLLATFLFCGTLGFAQQVDSLKANNWTAGVYDNGGMFNHPEAFPLFHHTAWKADAIYAGNIWISATDAMDNSYVSAAMYATHSTDFEQGPIRDNQDFYYHSLLKVKRIEIEHHIANFDQPGYEMPASILEWRGNGNPANGEALDMAPFKDVNENGCYDPENGDYPIIRGDEAVYTIYSDGLKANEASGSPDSKIEVHSMLYGFSEEGNEDLNNTLFLRHTLINRSDVDYTIKVGQWMDFDIGRPDDDFVGCDSTENLFFSYNGDDNDEETGGASPGFGPRPPAVGVKFLDSQLHSFLYHGFGSGPQGFPQTKQEFINMLNGTYKDGTPIVDHNGEPTLYSYYGDPVNNTGWTEYTSNIKGDRRGMGTFPQTTIAPGERVHYDMLITAGRNLDPLEEVTAASNVGELKSRAKRMEEFYNLQKFDVGTLASNENCALAIAENVNDPSFEFAPNPTSGTITLQAEVSITDVSLMSIDGKVVFNENINNRSAQLDLGPTVENGIYLLKVILENGSNELRRIVVEK